MKKTFILTILFLSILFGGIIDGRRSESNVEPQKYEALQGGILVRWDIQQVDRDSTMIFQYNEIRVPVKATVSDIRQAVQMITNLDDFEVLDELNPWGFDADEVNRELAK